MSAPDCDLRATTSMPVDFDRLLRSGFWLHANNDERIGALRLWWAAWKEVPAGSVPNGDAVLARMAGYERDMGGWRVACARILHGFVECSDGRLYHSFLCEMAKDAARDLKRQANERARARRKRAARPGIRPGTGVPPDIRDQVWHEGVPIVRRLFGKSDAASRTFLGKLLKHAKDDCARVLTALKEATDLRPVEPAAWLVRACTVETAERETDGQRAVREALERIDAEARTIEGALS